MKKSSIIFRVICMAVCFALALSAVSVCAEEAVAEEVTAEEIVENVTEEAESVEETVAEEAEAAEETTAEEVETEPTAEEVEAEVEDGEEAETEEVVDLFAATLRDGGVFVTPSETNAAVFEYNNLRYIVSVGTENLINVEGFEDVDITIKDTEISETTKNILQANGVLTAKAAHSGYLGLEVSQGDVVYRAPVNGGEIYVFSAWFKFPKGGAVKGKTRSFNLNGESGNTYIVGYNEIGRDVENTYSWQQVLFTFKAPETGLFEMKFTYSGRDALYMDDIELYEAAVFDNPITIEEVEITYADGEAVENDTFSKAGTITHRTLFYNHDTDIYFKGIAVLYKNDIMIGQPQIIEDMALELYETEVVFTIEIPEDEDLSQYKYMVYFVDSDNPRKFYGDIWNNPYIVKGN